MAKDGTALLGIGLVTNCNFLSTCKILDPEGPQRWWYKPRAKRAIQGALSYPLINCASGIIQLKKLYL